MGKVQEVSNGITEGVIWKQILIFFFPIFFGTLFMTLYNTVDAVIVGQFLEKKPWLQSLEVQAPLQTSSSASSMAWQAEPLWS